MINIIPNRADPISVCERDARLKQCRKLARAAERLLKIQIDPAYTTIDANYTAYLEKLLFEYRQVIGYLAKLTFTDKKEKP
jgi:hypothetical protein